MAGRHARSWRGSLGVQDDLRIEEKRWGWEMLGSMRGLRAKNTKRAYPQFHIALSLL